MQKRKLGKSGLEENLGAANMELTAGELRQLNGALSKFEISGDRYPAELAKRAGD